jgi:hypothetical protein
MPSWSSVSYLEGADPGTWFERGLEWANEELAPGVRLVSAEDPSQQSMRYLLPGARETPRSTDGWSSDSASRSSSVRGAPGCCPYGKARTVSLTTRGDLGFEGWSRRV